MYIHKKKIKTLIKTYKLFGHPVKLSIYQVF